MNNEIYNLPEQYRPLSPWKYFWLSVLFSIPVVGFVFLIVFSFNSSNINRRNYARSYFCGLLIAVIVFAVVIGIAAALGATGVLFSTLEEGISSLG